MLCKNDKGGVVCDRIFPADQADRRRNFIFFYKGNLPTMFCPGVELGIPEEYPLILRNENGVYLAAVFLMTQPALSGKSCRCLATLSLTMDVSIKLPVSGQLCALRIVFILKNGFLMPSRMIFNGTEVESLK